jgi:glycosyltransferase involved in cell wall biosynthesis
MVDSALGARLKIVFIGVFSDVYDEGLNQLSNRFRRYFQDIHTVRVVNTKHALHPKTLRMLREFRPDIIHYITGPTVRSLFVLTAYRHLLNLSAKLVVSATRPYFTEFQSWMIKYLRPDFVFSQSRKWESVFRSAGVPTAFLPNPIDTDKFRKLAIPKDELRRRHGLPLDKKLVLHVGHFRNNRRLDILAAAQKRLSSDEIQFIIVGGTFHPEEHNIKDYLRSCGCVVIDHYVEAIEELYNACDVLVFPIDKLRSDYFPTRYDEVGVIDMPLSILEALSCGLPVIAPPIDSLAVLFNGMSSFPIVVFDGSEESLLEAIRSLPGDTTAAHHEVRNLVSSALVFRRINEYYSKIIHSS